MYILQFKRCCYYYYYYYYYCGFIFNFKMEAHKKPAKYCYHCFKIWKFIVRSKLLYRTISIYVQSTRKAIILLSAGLQPIYYLSYFIYLVTQIPEYCSLQLHVNILNSPEDKKASYCSNQSSHNEEET